MKRKDALSRLLEHCDGMAVALRSDPQVDRAKTRRLVRALLKERAHLVGAELVEITSGDVLLLAKAAVLRRPR